MEEIFYFGKKTTLFHIEQDFRMIGLDYEQFYKLLITLKEVVGGTAPKKYKRLAKYAVTYYDFGKKLIEKLIGVKSNVNGLLNPSSFGIIKKAVDYILSQITDIRMIKPVSPCCLMFLQKIDSRTFSRLDEEILVHIHYSDKPIDVAVIANIVNEHISLENKKSGKTLFIVSNTEWTSKCMEYILHMKVENEVSITLFLCQDWIEVYKAKDKVNILEDMIFEFRAAIATYNR